MNPASLPSGGGICFFKGFPEPRRSIPNGQFLYAWGRAELQSRKDHFPAGRCQGPVILFCRLLLLLWSPEGIVCHPCEHCSICHLPGYRHIVFEKDHGLATGPVLFPRCLSGGWLWEQIAQALLCLQGLIMHRWNRLLRCLSGINSSVLLVFLR